MAARSERDDAGVSVELIWKDSSSDGRTEIGCIDAAVFNEKFIGTWKALADIYKVHTSRNISELKSQSKCYLILPQ